MIPERQNIGLTRDITAIVQYAAMTQMMCVAAELRIADFLAGGPRKVDELAKASNSHPPSLRRLLRGLTTIDICTECDDGSFRLSALGSLLRTDAPDSLRSWLLWFGRYHWPTWARLLHSVKTGESARKIVTGTDGFVGLLERNPDAAALFNDTMAQLTRPIAEAVTHSYEFAGLRRIVDVGGGHGDLLARILRTHTTLHGVLFDLSHAVEGAKALMKQVGVEARCAIACGSFFDAIPRDGDAYILKDVLHDWDDEHAATILQNCRDAVAPGGKILVVERLMPDRLSVSPDHRTIAYADMAMLVGPGGRQRTEIEFRSLFGRAGLQLVGVLPVANEYSLIEAKACSPKREDNVGLLGGGHLHVG